MPNIVLRYLGDELEPIVSELVVVAVEEGPRDLAEGRVLLYHRLSTEKPARSYCVLRSSKIKRCEQ